MWTNFHESSHKFVSINDNVTTADRLRMSYCRWHWRTRKRTSALWPLKATRRTPTAATSRHCWILCTRGEGYFTFWAMPSIPNEKYEKPNTPPAPIISCSLVYNSAVHNSRLQHFSVATVHVNKICKCMHAHMYMYIYICRCIYTWPILIKLDQYKQ